MSATSTLRGPQGKAPASAFTQFETALTTGDMALLGVRHKSPTAFYQQQVIKRYFDIAFAAVTLVVTMPLMMVIMMAIRFTSPGPIFYFSQRIGKNKHPFYMVKFRTMSTDAEKLRQKLCQEQHCNDKLFKMENDPRVTPVGNFLRKTSLDELPQLINVLKGDMSLVGPRPYIPEESQLFKPPYTLRYQVLPGMTGAWQINGRSNLSFKELCHLELCYLRDWSLVKDLVIILKTIPAVLSRNGAF